MAVPAESVATANGDPSVASNLARILHCGTESRVGTSGRVRATTNSGGWTIYCKDVTKDWYFGFIHGEHFGATFAVKPNAIFKEQYKSTDINTLKNLEKGSQGIIHEKLIEILKLATGDLKTFRDVAKKVNGQSGSYTGQKYGSQWCEGGKCFLWGTIGSKERGDENTKNCGEDSKDFKGCNIGIIDVSRHTLGIWDIH